MGYDGARWGSVPFVQRFGSSLNINPHVHVLLLDGVYVDGEEAPVFVAAPPLSDPDVQQIVQTSARRIIRLCTKPLRGQTGPGGGPSAHHRSRAPFLRAQNAVVGWDEPPRTLAP